MKMQDTYTNAAHNQVANAVIMANGSPLTQQLQGISVDYLGYTETPITMSSLEIANLTGKRHDNVMKDVRQLLGELGQDALMFKGIYQDSYKRNKPCFNLPRREVDILLTGYSPTMRAAVIDRWRDLEIEKAMGVFAIPTTLAGALKLAAKLEGERLELTYRVETLEQKAAEDAVKSKFYDDITGTEGLFNPITASKLLGTGRTSYLQYLRDHKILMSRPHRINMPYQKYMEAGLFEVKLGDYENPKTGEIEAKAHPMLTGKGVIWLKQFIDQNGRDGL